MHPPAWNLLAFGRYPLSIYTSAIQFFLSWIIPFGFATFYPSVRLLNHAEFHRYALLSAGRRRRLHAHFRLSLDCAASAIIPPPARRNGTPALANSYQPGSSEGSYYLDNNHACLEALALRRASRYFGGRDVVAYSEGKAALHPARRGLTSREILEVSAVFDRANAEYQDFVVAAADGASLKGWLAYPAATLQTWPQTGFCCSTVWPTTVWACSALLISCCGTGMAS